jgi:Tol biopolymer transport system component
MTLGAGSALGPYEIVSLLGAGGMGEVYRARDGRLLREVAIKVLPPELSADAGRLRRFEKESRAASVLNHPNIVTIYEVGSESGTSYIVMELVAGRTLRELLLAGAVPLRKILQIAAPLAEGLAAAHEAGIVHRDLKPENVMVTRDGLVKILDFGLAKLTATVGSGEGSLPTISRTEPGGLLGTVGYMSPEQAAGQPADFRSDQFSFGAILYEMAAGRKAFHRETAVDTLSAILHEEPEPIASVRRDLPEPFCWVSERCLAKDPAARYHSTRDLARDLSNLRDRLSGTSGVAVAAGLRPLRIRRFLVARILAALGLVAAAALAAVYFARSPPPGRPARFTIPLPEKLSSSGDGLVEWHNLAVSPDGSRVAFVAKTEEAHRIWIRPLRALSAQPVAGTDDAVSPFWSPDGSQLAFFASGKLKRIAASGGLAQTLCEVSSRMTQGSWGTKGTILFAQGGMFDRGLYEVSASGGTPRLISAGESWREYGGYRWPRFLPDGQRFLCLAWGGQENGSSFLLAGRLDATEVRRISPLDSRVEFARPGYLLYVQDGALVARSFDEVRLRFTGEAFPVAEGIPYFGGTGWAPFSVAEGGTLAFQAGSVAASLRWVDRGGLPLATAGSPGAYGQLRLSRDGSRIAVQQFSPPRGLPVLWIGDLSRGVMGRLSSDGFYEFGPVWSPDGNAIIYSLPSGEVRFKRADDPGPGEVLFPPDEKGPQRVTLDCSPDGDLLLYAQTGATGRDLWVLPLTGSRKPIEFRHTEFDEGEGGAAFSPDGRWVAFLSNETGREEVYVAPFRGSGQRIVSTGGAALLPPRWRRDGREIFYVAADSHLMSVPVRVAASGFESDAPVALFRMGSDLGNSYDVASDGRRFLINPGTNLEYLPITVVLDWAAEARR